MIDYHLYPAKLRFSLTRFYWLSFSREQDDNKRLENMGHIIGFRYVESISAQHKLIGRDPLDLMKFLCKDLWEELFRKKIDKLQTNHRGVFVLTDFSFKWLEKYVPDNIESAQPSARIQSFSCGIIKGALSNLGLTCVVSADLILSTSPPGCTFTVKVKSGGS